MKPAEHPEFFTFPAPGGRSRESTIVLDENGRFWHEGQEVVRPAMRQAFSRWLMRHPIDQRYILSNGYDWTYIAVLGAPLRVHALKRAAGGELSMGISDGRWIALGAPLWLDADGVLCVIGRAPDLVARFTATAQASLGDALAQTKDGSWCLESGGRNVRIGTVAPLGLEVPIAGASSPQAEHDRSSGRD